MFYDIDTARSDCEVDPSLLFYAIKDNYRDVYEYVIDKGIDLNITDEFGDNILMKLLKNKDYDLVNKYILNEDLMINHQNNDGDTIVHILVTHNYIDIKDILENVLKREDFLPNIKNNVGETILDKSLKNRYLYTTIQILKDKRFNSITLKSFKDLYDVYIKSNEYGMYSKLNNFTLIVDNLKKKDLLPRMKKLIFLLKKDEKTIKNDFLSSKTGYLDNIINNMIKETI